MTESEHIVAIFGGAVAGSEAASKLTERGIRCVVFEQNPLPYGKLESGLPKWHVKLRNKEEAKIDEKLKHHLIEFVPSVTLGTEIDFNDIRTTLQALYAIYDNCNSLHTNAYDEAITTPTEESVRRAMAIQLIINKELGLAKNENPIQGSFIIEELTDLVEEAVLIEFTRRSSIPGSTGRARGGTFSSITPCRIPTVTSPASP